MRTFRKGREGVKGAVSLFPQQRKLCQTFSKATGQELAKATLVTSSKEQKQGLQETFAQPCSK